MKNAMIAALMLAVVSSVAFAQQTPPATQPMQGRDPNTGLAFTIKPSDGKPPAKEWIDKDTGHRVIRLSDEPNSLSLYFHQYAYSTDGTKLFFTSPTGIYQVDLSTHNIELILAGDQKQGENMVRNNIIQVGRKTGHIFFTRTVVNDGLKHRRRGGRCRRIGGWRIGRCGGLIR